MIINSKDIEKTAALEVAEAMCVAARTAPKTRGVDHIVTAILTKKDITALSDEMIRVGKECEMGFFCRDGECVRKCHAVVLIGTTEEKMGLGDNCGLCHHTNCMGCVAADGVCFFNPIDLGIAVGSAVSVAADRRVDTRVMFSVGKTALGMGIFDKSVTAVLGIPLSITGKSPFFDR